MPNKTIYVADSDLPVFDRAQELAGENLSATIAQALRHFIATEEARTQGFGEITLKVGHQMPYANKQFIGRELVRHRSRDAETARLMTQTVFLTAKGRFVLYTRFQPEWGDWTMFLDRDWDRVWDWNWDMSANPGPFGSREQAKAARDAARAEAKARRDEWRQRMRETRGAGRERGTGRERDGGWGPFDWSQWAVGGEYDMEVYDTLDDLRPHISEELFAAVSRAMGGDDVEFLDI